MLRAGTAPRGGREDEGYLASVSDLMVGMLFVFIIVLMGFALNYRSAEGLAQADRSRLLMKAPGSRPSASGSRSSGIGWRQNGIR